MITPVISGKWLAGCCCCQTGSGRAGAIWGRQDGAGPWMRIEIQILDPGIQGRRLHLRLITPMAPIYLLRSLQCYVFEFAFVVWRRLTAKARLALGAVCIYKVSNFSIVFRSFEQHSRCCLRWPLGLALRAGGSWALQLIDDRLFVSEAHNFCLPVATSWVQFSLVYWTFSLT